MAEEKMASSKYCGHTSKVYTLLGTLAIVYGVINYMIDVMTWQPYMAWVLGGIILLLISWAKKSTSNS